MKKRVVVLLVLAAGSVAAQQRPAPRFSIAASISLVSLQSEAERIQSVAQQVLAEEQARLVSTGEITSTDRLDWDPKTRALFVRPGG